MQKAGLVLPPPPKPAGIYVPALQSGTTIWTSGQLPLVDGRLVEPGGIGPVGESAIEQAASAARTALLNALAAIGQLTGSLECIEQVLKMTVYVASKEGFSSQHLVANGPSSLLGTLFEERGVHARSAVGVAALPLNASVELEIVVAVTPR